MRWGQGGLWGSRTEWHLSSVFQADVPSPPTHIHQIPSNCPTVQEVRPSPIFPSLILQAALQAAAHASVDIKNVLDFYKQWKEIG